MRVLLVADAVGGVRTFVEELVRELGAEMELHLALLGDRPVECGAATSVELRPLSLEWMPDPWADLDATAAWIEELRCALAPDLIHMNTFARVRDPAVPVLLTVHSCVLTWWRAVHGTDAPAAWRRYARLAQAALDRADLLVAPTRALLAELEAAYGRLPKARVVPNGRAVGRWDGDGRERLVVTVGRLWDEAKNAALLGRAAPAIAGRALGIGPGEVDGLQSTGAVAADEAQRWLARATVFAEPARYEPFGLAALEAALLGCALVLGDIASLREVWGPAATYVPPDDPEQLAAAVNRLLDDPLPAARAAHGRALRYTPAATAQGYRTAYDTLVKAPARL